MQTNGMRFVVGCLIFWGGLHVVGFGMTENGSAVRGNPVWEMLSPLFDLEWMAVKGLAFTVLGAAGIVGVFFVSAALLGLVSMVTAKWKEIRPRAPKNPSLALPESDSLPDSVPEPETWIPRDTATQIPVVSPALATREPIQREIPRAPTPDELKRKAIRQIMGRK